METFIAHRTLGVEKALDKTIAQVAKAKKIGLWRTHPSFFWVAVYFIVSSAISAVAFMSSETAIGSYKNLFDYVPHQIYASIFIVGALLILIGLLAKAHAFLGVGAAVLLVPNVMMVTNFVLLVFTDGPIGLLVAISKWGLSCLMLILMLREPFINPLSAR